MLNTPFAPWPSFTQEEASAVSDVLLSNKVNYWTGQHGREFEKEFAAWADSNYAIALTNGTVALDLALKALDVGPGDEVIVTSRTFLASASSIVTAGAVPIFADVDAASQNITADTVRKVLTERTKAIICVHLAGWPCDMDPIMALAEEQGLYVIEDCAQAHGARYKGRSVGSIGHVSAWSFCQDKIMTTGGEGGMVTTNDRELWSRMWSYKDHGKSWEAIYEREHPPGFRWLHDSFGTNWRMTELQAVIGRIQLKRMADWTAARTANAERIWHTCEDFDVLRVPQFNGAGTRAPERASGNQLTHAHYKCYVQVRPEQLAEGWSRDRIVEEIVVRGVPCFQGSCSEVYLEKAFDNTAWRPAERLPVARELGETSLMFLVHPTLTTAELSKTCDVIAEVVGQAGAR
ncbi:DegT/DnrJ/EryC1/StrS family aminotransferase [Halopseudomonas pelagia]|uniref:DegT/DnrJ/EryC1/StrS family aminotransferase n=1 Tax=Halopseudomonas pelagia TaxID=553151 RepID=UPI00039DC86D|nr:DegT/DnrJ/EryC1/StrS aminotransferase family protein [Halopseudomonas pelagia]